MDDMDVPAVAVELAGVEDVQYSALREDLEADGRDFDSPTWSLSVDQQYLKEFSKEAIKRQDVIHELIQTEVNHVRTLKVMWGVYYCAVQNSPKDEVQVDRLFPHLKHLLREHQLFLERLKQCRQDSLEPGSQQNYCISNVGDLLKNQFSGELRNKLLEGYSVFCSRHIDAVTYYKELMQNNKKFMSLMKKLGQLAIVRRLGVMEGILLITQRITKYPVLMERILKNTEAGTEEHKNLVSALECIKETISQVDEQVHHYEKLREMMARLEPKSQGRMSSGQVLRREDLVQPGRKVLREGLLSWRTQNRSKVSDVLLVLMSDLLLLLQEKDQKLVFASLDGKPAVLSLEGLLVREAAQSDRVMYLISTSTENTGMYEFQTSTGEERTSWRQDIWQAVESFLNLAEQQGEEEVSDQEEAFSERLRYRHDHLCVADAQITMLLQFKLKIFSEIAAMVTDGSVLPKHLLLNGTSTELQQGALLLKSVTADVEGLQRLLLPDDRDPLCPSPSKEPVVPGIPSRRANTIGYSGTSDRGFQDGFRTRNQRPNSDPQLRDLYLDSVELSADDDDERSSAWHCPLPVHVPVDQLYEAVVKLTQNLYTLQAVVAHQDSELEISRAAVLERPVRYRGNGLLVQEKQRHLEKQREELLELQKAYSLQKQEQAEWEQEHQRHLQEKQAFMKELKQKEEECMKEEARLATEREALASSRKEYQQDLERLREAILKIEKDRETLDKDRERLEQQKKNKKHNTISNPGAASFYQDLAQSPSVTDVPVFSPKVRSRPGLTKEILQEKPPQVPPRKESIFVPPPKPDVPLQLLSATNEALKSGPVQQKIPTHLAKSKGKEKNKGKSSHHRTKSAELLLPSSLELPAIVPTKVLKEGGSLRAQRSTSPRPLSAEMYIPPELVLNVKPPLYQPNIHASRKPSHAAAPRHPPRRKGKDGSAKEDVYYC